MAKAAAAATAPPPKYTKEQKKAQLDRRSQYIGQARGLMRAALQDMAKRKLSTKVVAIPNKWMRIPMESALKDLGNGNFKSAHEEGKLIVTRV